MSHGLTVFLFGLVVFCLGMTGLLLFYAAAAEEQAEHEHSALARLTLRISRILGLK